MLKQFIRVKHENFVLACLRMPHHEALSFQSYFVLFFVSVLRFDRFLMQPRTEYAHFCILFTCSIHTEKSSRSCLVVCTVHERAYNQRKYNEDLYFMNQSDWIIAHHPFMAICSQYTHTRSPFIHKSIASSVIRTRKFPFIGNANRPNVVEI